jgi:preprotein translocase subunit SecA
MRQVEKAILLQTLDHVWREHLVTLDHLRQVIGFRGYAQRDPLNEYKSEAFELFQKMLSGLRQAVVGQLTRIELVQRDPNAPPPPGAAPGPGGPPTLPPNGNVPRLTATHLDPNTGENEIQDSPSIAPGRRTGRGSAASGGAAAFDASDATTWSKTPRNAPCPCGSGKKFKHCHGQLS